MCSHLVYANIDRESGFAALVPHLLLELLANIEGVDSRLRDLWNLFSEPGHYLPGLSERIQSLRIQQFPLLPSDP